MYAGRHVKYPLCLFHFIEIAFLRQIFEKPSNVKFRENPSSGSRVVPCGRTDGKTDRHDEANSRSSQFCELD
jgi:hypothetical protein